MKIKEYRLKIGLSQAEMSKKLEIPASTLFNYETERAEPSVETLIKYADIFNISIDELVGRDCELLNLKYLDNTESFLIKKILKMNQFEKEKTKAYVMGLTE